MAKIKKKAKFQAHLKQNCENGTQLLSLQCSLNLQYVTYNSYEGDTETNQQRETELQGSQGIRERTYSSEKFQLYILVLLWKHLTFCVHGRMDGLNLGERWQCLWELPACTFPPIYYYFRVSQNGAEIPAPAKSIENSI